MNKRFIIISIIPLIVIIALVIHIFYLTNLVSQAHEEIDLLRGLFMEFLYANPDYSFEFEIKDDVKNNTKEYKKLLETDLQYHLLTPYQNYFSISRIPVSDFFNILDNKEKMALFDENGNRKIYFSEWIKNQLDLISGDNFIRIEYILCDADNNGIYDSMFVQCKNKLLFLEGIEYVDSCIPAIDISSENIVSIFNDETILTNDNQYKHIEFGLKNSKEYSFNFIESEKPDKNIEESSFIYYKTVIISSES